MCDPNGAFMPMGPNGLIQNITEATPIVVNGCDYFQVTTCVIPATKDSDPTAGVQRHLPGAEYQLALTINGQQCSFPIVIDAAADYTGIEDADGCLQLKGLLNIVTPPDPGQPGFNDAVCATACISEIKTQIQAGGAGGTISDMTVVENADGTTTVTHDPGDGTAPTVFTYGGAGGAGGAVSGMTVVDNGDGTTTVTHDPGDGSTPTVFTYGGSDCCYVEATLTDPDTCDPVLAVIDTSDLAAGAAVTYLDVNGQPWLGDPAGLSADGCGTTSDDLCAQVQALPVIADTAKPVSTMAVDDAGACVLIEATPVIYADAASQEWEDTNPNWVDPASCPEFTELRVYNDPFSGGTAIYRNLEQDLGAATGLQWHPIA